MDPRTGAEITEGKDVLKQGESAIVKLEPIKPIVLEKRDVIPELSSFVLRDMGLTVGAGVVTEINQKV